jgi:hypothetical protein
VISAVIDMAIKPGKRLSVHEFGKKMRVALGRVVFMDEVIDVMDYMAREGSLIREVHRNGSIVFHRVKRLP